MKHFIGMEFYWPVFQMYPSTAQGLVSDACYYTGYRTWWTASPYSTHLNRMRCLKLAPLAAAEFAAKTKQKMNCLIQRQGHKSSLLLLLDGMVHVVHDLDIFRLPSALLYCQVQILPSSGQSGPQYQILHWKLILEVLILSQMRC